MKRSMSALATVLGFAAATSGAAQGADLRMSWWGGDSRHTATQAALEACGAKHGHSIAPEFTGWSGHLEKVTTQIAGGTEADIMQINWPWLPIFSRNGDGFADMNELSGIIDLSNWSEAQLAAGTRNGKLNGLPASTTGRVHMLNKTSYDRAGVALPTTWDEMIAAGPMFKEKLGDDYYPLEGTKLDASLMIQSYLTQRTGKPMIDDAAGTIGWSEAEVAEGLAFYQSLVDNHVVMAWPDAAAKGNVVLHEDPKWADGHIGGSYQWDSTYFKISDPMNDDQELVPAGILKAPGATNDGVYRKASMVFSISAKSENKDAAAQVLNCLLNEPEGIAAMGTARGLPASKAALMQLQAAGEINAVQKAANDIVLAAEAPAISPFTEHSDVRAVVEDTLEMFAYGQISAEDAAAEIVAGVNEVLADL